MKGWRGGKDTVKALAEWFCGVLARDAYGLCRIPSKARRGVAVPRSFIKAWTRESLAPCYECSSNRARFTMHNALDTTT